MNFSLNNLEPFLTEADLTFSVLGNVILARGISLRHPIFQDLSIYWDRVSGAELWGICRLCPVEGILLASDQNLKLVGHTGNWTNFHLEISHSEFAAFLSEYCDRTNKIEIGMKINWLVEGF